MNQSHLDESEGGPPHPKEDTDGRAQDRIVVTQLNKTFQQDDRTIHAVRDLSFSVKAGEVFGLLGANGAGKTTTIRMILGLIQPDSGFAAIEGIRSDRQPDLIKHSIGFVSANTGLYQWLTARETLLFFAAVYGVPKKHALQRLEEVAAQLEMKSFLDQRCGLLSTGQTQRVNLAKALIHSPPIMLLDEPTLGLDVVGSQVVFEYLELLKDQQCAVILSTHRLEQAQRVCDRFGLMDRGKMRLEGSWEEISNITGRKSLVEVFVDWNQQLPEEEGKPQDESLVSSEVSDEAVAGQVESNQEMNS